MTAICVDDEYLIMEHIVSMCRSIPQLTEVIGFTRAREALDWLRDHDADLALLDIDIPDMKGLTLAEEIRKLHPKTAIVFLTGFSEYAVKAFELHASGYLLKPVNRERLEAEVLHALGGKQRFSRAHIEARTFGNFDLFVDGELVTFRQAKCKELLAYLIDRQGGSVSRAEAFSVLWEDRMYDRPMQKQFDVIIRSLRDSLADHGIGEILEVKNGMLRVRPEGISCDSWRFFNGETEAIKAYRGEYMSAYSWGEYTASHMNRRIGEEEI